MNTVLELNRFYQQLLAHGRLTSLAICLLMAVTCMGCFGLSGGVGFRESLGDTPRVVRSGVYGNVGRWASIAATKNDQSIEMKLGFDSRAEYMEDNNIRDDGVTMEVGLSYNLFFSRGDVFHVIQPTVAVYGQPVHTYRLANIFEPTAGAKLGVGIEFGDFTWPGLHTSLCGGVYSEGQGYLCVRHSTRDEGWFGVDVNVALPPAVMLKHFGDIEIPLYMG
ncbi:MAG: hypothetical protein JXR76_30530 [Deltaproteobacteria bacterium]|nr:hypothetical protein [Deltaproteobacteria bacterium]